MCLALCACGSKAEASYKMLDDKKVVHHEQYGHRAIQKGNAELGDAVQVRRLCRGALQRRSTTGSTEICQEVFRRTTCDADARAARFQADRDRVWSGTTSRSTSIKDAGYVLFTAGYRQHAVSPIRLTEGSGRRSPPALTSAWRRPCATSAARHLRRDSHRLGHRGRRSWRAWPETLLATASRRPAARTATRSACRHRVEQQHRDVVIARQLRHQLPAQTSQRQDRGRAGRLLRAERTGNAIRIRRPRICADTFKELQQTPDYNSCHDEPQVRSGGRGRHRHRRRPVPT